MSSETKHFTVLSKSVLADLSAAKSETSQRFLKPRPMAAAAFAARAAAGRMFRPTAVATPTQNVVGVGIDEKKVLSDLPTELDGVPLKLVHSGPFRKQ